MTTELAGRTALPPHRWKNWQIVVAAAVAVALVCSSPGWTAYFS